MRIKEIIDQGIAFHQAGKTDQAEQCYRLVLEQKKDHPDALYLLGVLALEKGLVNQAVDLIEQAITHHPHDGIDYFADLAQGFLMQKKYQKAKNLYEKYLKKYPTDLTAQTYLGCTLKEMGEVDQAISRFSYVLGRVDINDKKTFIYNNLYECFNKLCKDREALEVIEKAVEENPRDISFLLKKASLFQKLGQSQKAEQIYSQLEKENPDHPDVLYERGLYYFKKNEFSKAQEYFERLTELHFSDPRAHYQLGKIYQIKEQWEKAVLEYQIALKYKDDFSAAYNDLGVVLGKLHRVEEAAEAWRMALNHDPELTEAMHNLATYLWARGQIEEAIDLYLKVLEKNPQETVVRKNIQDALKELRSAHYHEKADELEEKFNRLLLQ